MAIKLFDHTWLLLRVGIECSLIGFICMVLLSVRRPGVYHHHSHGWLYILIGVGAFIGDAVCWGICQPRRCS